MKENQLSIRDRIVNSLMVEFTPDYDNLEITEQDFLDAYPVFAEVFARVRKQILDKS